MADKKISALTSLGANVAGADMIPIVDVSDTTGAATGTTKRVLVSDFAATTAKSGVVELATTGEASTGTATDKVVTPAGVKAAVPAILYIPCHDIAEATALTTGAAKATFRMPAAMTLTAVRATVTTAPVGSTIIVDINDGGTTIMAVTKLSIDAGEKTSTTAAAAAVISDTALADDAEITIDIDQIGSGTAGAGLKVWLIGTWA